MVKISATDAKNHFGDLIDRTRVGPVTIEKQGRPTAIVLSPEEYARLESIEDMFWALKGELAEKSGFISVADSEDLLKNLGV